MSAVTMGMQNNPIRVGHVTFAWSEKQRAIKKTLTERKGTKTNFIRESSIFVSKEETLKVSAAVKHQPESKRKNTQR